MNKLFQKIRSIERNRHQSYEAYMAFERDKLLLDEITDASERISLPVESTFHYSLDAQGHIVTQADPPERLYAIIQKGLQVAEWSLAEQPDYAFEAERRRLELQEMADVELFAAGHKAAEYDTMVVLSPFPDDVRATRTKIGGYNRARQQAMVRIHQKTAEGIATTTMSLDQSNYQALQAVVGVLGYDLHTNLSSEQILAKRFYVNDADMYDEVLQDIPSILRAAYDMSLHEQSNKSKKNNENFYAGSHFASRQDALSFITHPSRADLLQGHIQAITDIMQRSLSASQKDALKEEARQNYAAALDDRLMGRQSVSLAAAGEIARTEGRDYSGSCATGFGAEAELKQQGLLQGEIMACVTCPFCGVVVNAEVTAGGGIRCAGKNSCGAEVDGTGKVLSTGKKTTPRAGMVSQQRSLGFFESIQQAIEAILTERRMRQQTLGKTAAKGIVSRPKTSR